MARISKRPVSEDILIRMYKLFFEIFSRFENQEHFLALMDDVFSPVEKIMIAKRVGIIYLLIKKVDYRDISDVLKVSTSTITHYALLFHDKNSRIVEIIKTQLMKENVLNFLDDLFSDLLIQPGIKIGHHQLKWEQKQRQQKRKTLPV